MNRLEDIKIKFDNKYFRQLMKEKKWMNKDLAYETGIPFGTICNYSKGSRNPKVDALYKIAIALDCSMEDLLKEVEDE